MSFLSSLFGIFGGSRQQGQVVQSSKLPEEIAPFAKEVLEEAKKQYAASQEAGYTPYGGKTIADLTQEEQDAMSGIKGLVGLSRPLQEEALGITRGLGEKFTADTAAEYMSPYQRAVTDIEKREAQKTFERDIMPQFEKQAVEAGGMSGMGSRAAIQASQLGQAQMQQMGDIESRGLQQAYMNAQQQFAQQKARERTQAADLFAAGPAMLQSGLKEQGALQTVGEQKRALEQSKLDEAYYKFLEKQAYPKEKLAEYSGFVYGNPLMQERTRTSTSTQPRPSLGRQLLGLAGTGVGIYGMGGGFKPGGQFSWGNIAPQNWANVANFGMRQLPRKEGGSVGGLSSLPVVYRQQSGTVGSTGLAIVEPEYPRSITDRITDALQAKLGPKHQHLLEEKKRLDDITRRRYAESERKQIGGASQTEAYGPNPNRFPLPIKYQPVPVLHPTKRPDDGISSEERKAIAEGAFTTDEIAVPGSGIPLNIPEGDVTTEDRPDGKPPPTGVNLSALQAKVLQLLTDRGPQNVIETNIAENKKLHTQLKTARQADLGSAARRAIKQNETNFWLGVLNTATRIGGTTDNVFNIIRHEVGTFFEKHQALDDEIATKEGQERIDAIKSKINMIQKDNELQVKLLNAKSNKVKAISAFLKSVAPDLKLSQKNYEIAQKIIKGYTDTLIDKGQSPAASTLMNALWNAVIQYHIAGKQVPVPIAINKGIEDAIKLYPDLKTQLFGKSKKAHLLPPKGSARRKQVKNMTDATRQ